MNLVLVRHAYQPDVTLGRLHVNGTTFATLEEPWLPNPKGKGGMRAFDGRESCVPDGSYSLHPHSGAKFKDVFRLFNPDLGVFHFPGESPSTEWGRATILIHSGNTTSDILGCILVGMRHWSLDGKPAVLESRTALEKLRALLAKGEHRLTIRPTFGTEEGE